MPETTTTSAVERALKEAHACGDRDGLTEMAVMLDGELPPPEGVFEYDTDEGVAFEYDVDAGQVEG